MVNVGLGIPLSRLRDRAEVKVYLDAFVARHPGLAKGEVIEEVAGGVTSSLPVDRSVADGLLLAGGVHHAGEEGAGVPDGETRPSGLAEGRYEVVPIKQAIPGNLTPRTTPP